MLNKSQDDDLVMSLVELALACSPEERPNYLRSACGDDTKLLEQVRSYVEWEERMNGFLLDPLYPQAREEPRLEPDDLLDGRFRIIREIAQGGMGVVYEAVDEKLERRVAIKCAKAGYRKRLPPEVRNAREISHPNVCRIHEIHTASTERGELEFLVMEFLDGETLAKWLCRGPVPEAQARTIARQLAAGLAEAHRHGIVHGDLKSNNIILTSGPDREIRAVITDFGLARIAEGASRSGPSSELAGTPSYMAPELWKGEKATPASDLYALGVIYYELVARRKPFPETERVSWEERLTRKPLRVNPKWDRLLGRCLEPDPKRRYRNGEQVAKALAPSGKRNRFLAATAAALLAIFSGVVTYERATAPKETVRLAMLPFETDSDTARLAPLVQSGVTKQLARLRGNTHTKFILTSDAKSATHMMGGSLTGNSGKIRLRSYIADQRSHGARADWQADYAPDEIRYAPVALAGTVTSTLRLPPLAIALAMTGSASQELRAAQADLRSESKSEGALAHLNRAVQLDPNSALSFATLAEAQVLRYSITRDKVWLDRAVESVRQAELRNSDFGELHHMKGLLQSLSGRYEQAIAQYERAIELEPANGDVHRHLGQAYRSDGQSEKAFASFLKAIDVDPGSYRNHEALADYYYRHGDFDSAARYFQAAVTIAPDEPNARFNLANAQISLGRFQDAEQQLRVSLGIRETPNALGALGLALLYERKESEAIPYLLQRLKIEFEQGSYVSWTHLGIAYFRTGREPESQLAFRKGVEAAQLALTRDPRSGHAHSFLAYLCARTGAPDRARSEVSQALQLSPQDNDTRWLAVLTYEALRDPDAAFGLLTTAPASVIRDLSRWPDAADLSQDPRFLGLIVKN